MSNFRPIDREPGFLLPPSVDEWLPKTHLARFVVEGIDGLDLSAMTKSYRGSGSASYHPAVLLGIVVSGYATGVVSSRKLERATYDSVAVRFLTANQHPDHDTLATVRRRFLAQIEGLFVQVLLVAREMGMLKLGTVALDGTKIHANASRHSALSYEHATKIEAQLKAEVAELLAKAEAADQAGIPDGLSIPEELARREERLRKLAEARAKIIARAKERFAREQADYQAKLAARDAKAAASGKKSAGRPPQPPVETPLPTDQINLTDEASRIMPVAGGGSSSATTRRPWWPRAACWWWLPMWCRRPTTSSSLRRCWARLTRCPRDSAGQKHGWPTAAISARRTAVLPAARTWTGRRHAGCATWRSTRRPVSASKTWSAAAGSIASCATSAPASRRVSPASSGPTAWPAAPGAGSPTSRPMSGPRWWPTTSLSLFACDQAEASAALSRSGKLAIASLSSCPRLRRQALFGADCTFDQAKFRKYIHNSDRNIAPNSQLKVKLLVCGRKLD